MCRPQEKQPKIWEEPIEDDTEKKAPGAKIPLPVFNAKPEPIMKEPKVKRDKIVEEPIEDDTMKREVSERARVCVCARVCADMAAWLLHRAASCGGRLRSRASRHTQCAQHTVHGHTACHTRKRLC
jgi:hypothetical protein